MEWGFGRSRLPRTLARVGSKSIDGHEKLDNLRDGATFTRKSIDKARSKAIRVLDLRKAERRRLVKKNTHVARHAKSRAWSV